MFTRVRFVIATVAICLQTGMATVQVFVVVAIGYVHSSVTCRHLFRFCRSVTRTRALTQ